MSELSTRSFGSGSASEPCGKLNLCEIGLQLHLEGSAWRVQKQQQALCVCVNALMRAVCVSEHVCVDASSCVCARVCMR